jgi:hypothetical protein
MTVTFSNDSFSIQNVEGSKIASIRTNESTFDGILSLFLNTSQEKKKPRKIRFE